MEPGCFAKESLMGFRRVGIGYITKWVEHDFDIVLKILLHTRVLGILEHIVNGMMPS